MDVMDMFVMFYPQHCLYTSSIPCKFEFCFKNKRLLEMACDEKVTIVHAILDSSLSVSVCVCVCYLDMPGGDSVK